MKYFVYTLFVLSVLMAGFNASLINFSSPFSSDSFIAIIAFVAALCVTILSLILIVSKKIENIFGSID